MVYLSRSYYGKWALRLENMVVELGFAGADELAAGHALRPGKPLKRKFDLGAVARTLTRGSFSRPAQAPARFKIGDRVRTKNIHPADAYASAALCPRPRRHHRSDRAAVTCFPTRSRSARGEDPQWLYTVLFDGPRIVGRECRPDAHSLDRSIRAVSGAGVANFPSGSRTESKQRSAKKRLT